jgi:hypothetical protein
MAITEHQRNKLHNRAHEVLGTEEGDALMELLPPTNWGDVATRRDLDQSGTSIRAGFRAEFADFRTEITTQFADFRTEITTQFADFRSEMRGELASQRAETKADLADVHKAISRMTWTMTVAMITSVVASAGFAFTAGLAL